MQKASGAIEFASNMPFTGDTQNIVTFSTMTDIYVTKLLSICKINNYFPNLIYELWSEKCDPRFVAPDTIGCSLAIWLWAARVSLALMSG